MKTSEMSVKTFEFSLAEVESALVTEFTAFDAATTVEAVEITWAPIFDPASKQPFTILTGLQATVTVRTEEK